MFEHRPRSIVQADLNFFKIQNTYQFAEKMYACRILSVQILPLEKLTSLLPEITYLLIVKSNGRSCSISTTFSFLTRRSCPQVLFVSTMLPHMFCSPYCRSTVPSRCLNNGFCVLRIKSDKIFVFSMILSLLCTQHL